MMNDTKNGTNGAAEPLFIIVRREVETGREWWDDGMFSGAMYSRAAARVQVRERNCRHGRFFFFATRVR